MPDVHFFTPPHHDVLGVDRLKTIGGRHKNQAVIPRHPRLSFLIIPAPRHWNL